jgi:hypothetical protein
MKSGRSNRRSAALKTGDLNLKDPCIEEKMGRESKALHQLHFNLQFERRQDWQVAQCVQDHDW